MALGLGGASANFIILMNARDKKEVMPIVMESSMKPLGKMIYAGLILVIIGGIGFSILGYQETNLLFVKHFLVIILLIAGSLMMFYVLPRLSKFAPKQGERPSSEFISTQKMSMPLGIISLVLWYLITGISVFL